VNSFRMKFAVIFGIVHMLLGVSIKGLNCVFFRKRLDFLFEFIPQLVFMTVVLGYMVFLIVYKWILPWGQTPQYPTSEAPNIINTMVNMYLNFGLVQGTPLYGDSNGQTQENLQKTIFIIALICVPLMLFVKPLLLWLRTKLRVPVMKKKDYIVQVDEHEAKNPSKRKNWVHLEEDKEEEKGIEMVQIQVNKDDKDKDKEEAQVDILWLFEKEKEFVEPEEISEIFIEQMIQTIEFVLGSVSNTASYLRLWALSLAHSQLSKVFMENTIGPAFKSGNPLSILINLVVFGFATFGILICMDAMECFLHTLRLHWVEFQNKFYHGDGHKFVPYSFQNILVQRQITVLEQSQK